MSTNQWRIGMKGVSKQALIGIPGTAVKSFPSFIHPDDTNDYVMDFATQQAWDGPNQKLVPITDYLSTVRASAQTVFDTNDNILKLFPGNNTPAYIDTGLASYAGRTNNCTNFNANPTATTNMTKSGDAAATLTVVDDTASLAAAGLNQQVCTSGKVFLLDNTNGVAIATAQVGGVTGTLSGYVASAYVRGTGTFGVGIALGGGTTAQNLTATGSYVSYASGVISGNSSRQFTITVAAGAKVWFILNQLELNAATTPVITAGAAMTYASDTLTLQGNILTAAKSAAVTFVLQYRPKDQGGTQNYTILNSDAGPILRLNSLQIATAAVAGNTLLTQAQNVFTGVEQRTVLAADATGRTLDHNDQGVVTDTNALAAINTVTLSNIQGYFTQLVVKTRRISDFDALLASQMVQYITNIGDSITYGNNAAPRTTNGWVYLLGSALGLVNKNNGFPGAPLQNTNAAGGVPINGNIRNNIVLDALSNKTGRKATILIGINDLGQSRSYPLTLAIFKAQFAEVLNAMMVYGWTPSNISMSSLQWVMDAWLALTPVITRQTIIDWNTAIRDLAVEFGCAYTDSYTYMQNNGGDTLIDADNLHPNNAGHIALKNSFLQAAVLNTKPKPVLTGFTSPGAGQATLTWTAPTPPSGLTITGYDAQVGIMGTAYAFTTTATVNALSNAFSGLATGSYNPRLRANYSDGSHSPWVFRNKVLAVA
jgi:lysophospholipase L1-like esterase